MCTYSVLVSMAKQVITDIWCVSLWISVCVHSNVLQYHQYSYQGAVLYELRGKDRLYKHMDLYLLRAKAPGTHNITCVQRAQGELHVIMCTGGRTRQVTAIPPKYVVVEKQLLGNSHSLCMTHLQTTKSFSGL